MDPVSLAAGVAGGLVGDAAGGSAQEAAAMQKFIEASMQVAGMSALSSDHGGAAGRRRIYRDGVLGTVPGFLRGI